MDRTHFLALNTGIALVLLFSTIFFGFQSYRLANVLEKVDRLEQRIIYLQQDLKNHETPSR